MVTDTDQTTVTSEVNSTNTEATTTSDTTNTSQMEGASEGSEGSNETNVTALPKYTPNYKLKVYDEEKELDDPFLKELIKDEVSEKKVKEIAQKYLGFDTVKSRNEKLKTEFQTYQQQTQPVVQYYQEASTLLQKKDLDGFFELIGIPNEAIFQYAVQKAEEAQLPADQRYQIQQQKQIQRDREMLANQNQDLQSKQHQQLSDFRNQELSWVMQRPDVTSVVQTFDSKNGPGAFRQLVIDRGLAHFAATGGREDLTAEQATMQVMKMIGAFVTPTNSSPSQPGVMQAANQPQLIQQNGQPPIIPNATGRGSSPVKKQIRSIADLKRKREELSSS